MNQPQFANSEVFPSKSFDSTLNPGTPPIDTLGLINMGVDPTFSVWLLHLAAPWAAVVLMPQRARGWLLRLGRTALVETALLR